VVLVELDPSRLSRIGIRDINDIRIPKIVSADDIVLPLNNNNNNNIGGMLGWVVRPFWVLQEALTEAFSRIARALLTGMYKDMSDKINNPVGGGGEFLVAIRAAEQISACTTLILGDRSSITTIKRAATLAIQSGDPLGVLQRLQEANSEEMSQLEQQVRQKLQAESETKEVDEAQVSITMMETLKEDSQFRNRLFRKLEQQVPEFTQAFLKERDYIMAEAIRRELESDATIERVVGVVGLAHVAGVE
jgi:pheromone shutdown protein TraB